MRKELRLFGALGLAAGCHAYDEGLLVAAVSAPRASDANQAGRTAVDAGAAHDTPNSGSAADARAESGETDNAGEVAPGDAGAADSGEDSSPTTSAGAAGDAASGSAGRPSGSTGTGGTAGTAASNDDAGTASAAGSGGSMAGAGSGGSGTAPMSEAELACARDGGRVWAANQHCYFPLDSAESWNVSRDRCANLDAALVAITTADEQAFVSTLVGTDARWIGFSRFGSPSFSWISGDPVDYTNWETGGSAVAGDAAAVIRSDTLLWSVQEIAATHAALCERTGP